MNKKGTYKTKQEIENLKDEWRHHPSWEIEETEGFELYKDDLLKYRLKIEQEFSTERINEINIRAEILGCNYHLAEYIIRLEYRLEKMQDEIDNLGQ